MPFNTQKEMKLLATLWALVAVCQSVQYEIEVQDMSEIPNGNITEASVSVMGVKRNQNASNSLPTVKTTSTQPVMDGQVVWDETLTFEGDYVDFTVHLTAKGINRAMAYDYIAVDELDIDCDHVYAHKMNDILFLTIKKTDCDTPATIVETDIDSPDPETGATDVAATDCQVITQCELDFNECYMNCANPCNDFGGICQLNPGRPPDARCVRECEMDCWHMANELPDVIEPLYTTWRQPDECDWYCGTACYLYSLSPGLFCPHIFCNGDTLFTDCSFDKTCWAKVYQCGSFSGCWKPKYD